MSFDSLFVERHWFSTQEVRKLFNNKFVVFIGDSVTRCMYKDFILTLSSDRILDFGELRRRGERMFLGDELLEGGELDGMHNGKDYKEIRQYQTPRHLVRFYFITRCYNSYMETIITDLAFEPQPDVIVMNSCLWDITRYGARGMAQYKDNLTTLFVTLERFLKPETLFVWYTMLPVAETVSGGVILEQIRFLTDILRLDVLLANFFSSQVASAHGFDVIDLHFVLRRRHDLRLRDGIHWDARAHRVMTNLLLRHVCEAWHVELPDRLVLDTQKLFEGILTPAECGSTAQRNKKSDVPAATLTGPERTQPNQQSGIPVATSKCPCPEPNNNKSGVPTTSTNSRVVSTDKALTVEVAASGMPAANQNPVKCRPPAVNIPHTGFSTYNASSQQVFLNRLTLHQRHGMPPPPPPPPPHGYPPIYPTGAYNYGMSHTYFMPPPGIVRPTYSYPVPPSTWANNAQAGIPVTPEDLRSISMDRGTGVPASSLNAELSRAPNNVSVPVGELHALCLDTGRSDNSLVIDALRSMSMEKSRAAGSTKEPSRSAQPEYGGHQTTGKNSRSVTSANSSNCRSSSVGPTGSGNRYGTANRSMSSEKESSKAGGSGGGRNAKQSSQSRADSSSRESSPQKRSSKERLEAALAMAARSLLDATQTMQPPRTQPHSSRQSRSPSRGSSCSEKGRNPVAGRKDGPGRDNLGSRMHGRGCSRGGRSVSRSPMQISPASSVSPVRDNRASSQRGNSRGRGVSRSASSSRTPVRCSPAFGAGPVRNNSGFSQFGGSRGRGVRGSVSHTPAQSCREGTTSGFRGPPRPVIEYRTAVAGAGRPGQFVQRPVRGKANFAVRGRGSRFQPY